MNIQLLLSGAQNQGSASMASSPLSASVDTPDLFRQALSQAASLPSTNAPLSATEADGQAPTQVQEQLAALQARLPLTARDMLAPQLAVDSVNSESLTPLDEIAARMNLLASFAESAEPVEALQTVAPELESLLQQLDLDQEQTAELLSALGIRPQAGMALESSDSAIELLSSLSEAEAGQLVSALSVMLASTTQSNAGASAVQKGHPGQVALSPALQGQPLNSGANRQDVSGALSATHSATNTPPTLLDVSNGQPTLASSQDVFTKIGPLASSMPSATSDELDPFLRAGQSAGALLPGSASAGSPSVAAPSSMPSLFASLGTPVNSPAWPSQLGQQLVQFAQRGGEQQIKMQLHPAELGPLSITLKVSEQGTQAHFLSSHMQVRQVIELAIPQLREALAEQGISLGETSVGEQHNSNEQAFAEKGNNAGARISGSATDSDQDTLTPIAENVSRSLDGRVDLYA